MRMIVEYYTGNEYKLALIEAAGPFGLDKVFDDWFADSGTDEVCDTINSVQQVADDLEVIYVMVGNTGYLVALFDQPPEDDYVEVKVADLSKYMAVY